MGGDTPRNSDEHCLRCLFCCIFVPSSTVSPPPSSLSTNSDSSSDGTKDTNKEGTRTFAQSNSMFQRLGISLERDPLELSRIMRAPSCDASQSTDDHIALNGERHLTRLQQSCEFHLMRQKAKDGQRSSTVGSGVTDNRSTESNQSNTNECRKEIDLRHSTDHDVTMLGSPMSAHPSKEWKEGLPMCTNLDDVTTSTISNLNNDEENEQLVNITMAYSEVLQLQGNAEKALEIVSKLLEDIQLPTKDQQQKSTKHIALCHRRLGVLYKVAGRRQEAERSVREYIKVIQENVQPTSSKDLAYAYALLSSIIDDIGGRSKEALAMDKLALELTAASNVLYEILLFKGLFFQLEHHRNGNKILHNDSTNWRF